MRDVVEHVLSLLAQAGDRLRSASLSTAERDAVMAMAAHVIVVAQSLSQPPKDPS